MVLRSRAHGWRRAWVLAMLVTALASVGLPAPAAAALVGSVRGTVTSAGEPVANAWVSFIPVTWSGDWAGRGGATTTDAEGRFEFADLYVDHVKIHVRSPAAGGRVSTYWPGAYTFADAEALRVTSAGVTADVDLPLGGSVRGRVVDADTGRAVTGARVMAHARAGAGWEAVGASVLGAAGEPGGFALADLPPIPVALEVTAPPGGNHLGQWYDDAGYFDAAQRLDGGATTDGVVIRLRRGAQLSGRVRDDVGAPVAGATVAVIGCPGLCPLLARTDATGAYRLGAIPPGPGLMVRFSADVDGYVEQWYRLPGQRAEARLDLVAGEERAGIDGRLTRGAFLTVRVVDERTGRPIPGVSAELQSRSDPLLGYLPGSRDRLIARSPGAAFPVDPAAGDPDGPDGGGLEPDPSGPADALSIGPVPPGEYRLALYPGRRNSAYLPVAWAGAEGIDPSGVLDLSPGDRREAVVRLARAQGEPPSRGGSGCSGGGDAAAASEPDRPPPWPGVFAGFLGETTPWAS